MSDMNQIVTVKNRTSEPLVGTWNGRQYDYPPNAEVHVPRIVAIASRHQNPQKGHGTPFEDWSSKAVHLLAILEDNDPTDPIEQSDAPQRWDTYLVNGPNTETIRPRGGYSEVKQSQPREADGGFHKP